MSFDYKPWLKLLEASFFSVLTWVCLLPRGAEVKYSATVWWCRSSSLRFCWGEKADTSKAGRIGLLHWKEKCLWLFQMASLEDGSETLATRVGAGVENKKRELERRPNPVFFHQFMSTKPVLINIQFLFHLLHTVSHCLLAILFTVLRSLTHTEKTSSFLY